MKIRDIRVQNLRNFGPDAPAVSFVDPDTNLVRPLTIMVGANGSGKTTLLEIIEWNLWYLWDSGEQVVYRVEKDRFNRLLTSIESSTRVTITLEKNGAIAPIESVADIDETRSTLKVVLSNGHAPGLRTVLANTWETDQLQYFPSYRQFVRQDRVKISEPPDERQTVYRYQPSSQWDGSLEQLWLWQNYLDLESGQSGQPNLLPFVETVQAVLGRDQKIKIHRGHVLIERPHRGDTVRLHELPSGEQQVLVIFGELVRRLKPGSIVMIDELEISLHPALQGAVLHHLRRLAQQHDLQVIITTHSMEIVAAADPSEIVNLDDMVFIERGATTAEASQ